MIPEFAQFHHLSKPGHAALKNFGRPFEQLESQLAKSHTGSGLGLAIAKSLTDLHGGCVRIRSTQGVGTIVLVRLPLERAVVLEQAEPQAAA